MTLILNPIPEDGASWTCPQDERKNTWPYVKRCSRPLIGLLPNELQEALKLPWPGVCKDHAEAFETEIPDDSNLSRFIKQNGS